MIERPKIERRTIYRIARLERRQMVRGTSCTLVTRSFPAASATPHGASAASSGFGSQHTPCGVVGVQQLMPLHRARTSRVRPLRF